MIGRALFVVLLVSVQLGGVGCTREHPQPRVRSEAGSRTAAKRVVAIAPHQANRPTPSEWNDPARAPSSSTPVRKTALAPQTRPEPMIPQDETLYPARTPDNREPLWRQRARTY